VVVNNVNTQHCALRAMCEYVNMCMCEYVNLVHAADKYINEYDAWLVFVFVCLCVCVCVVAVPIG
jgi:hypothetical protein